MQITNILNPTDFSQNSSYAYEIALNFARQNSARLHLLNVIEVFKHNPEKINFHDKITFERDQVFCAEEELERFINKYPNREVDIQTAVVAGKPHEEIIRYAKDAKIDLIIISTHGKTNLDHLIAGNVTKKVLKFSEIPVVCIKTGKSYSVSKTKEPQNLAENWVG
jgi:nucleotide-binding universal stress UspA family protein